MQNLVAAVATVDWRTHLRAGWTWSTAQSASGWAFLQTLPRTCKLALTHTAAVCLGEAPEYLMTPGFAPLRISDGWLLKGAVAGSFITLVTLFAAGLLRREPTVSSLALMATPGASVSQAD